MKLLLGRLYRPIEGEVIGELIHVDVITNELHWLHHKKTFVIPYERFIEYFCEASIEPVDFSGLGGEGPV